MLQDVGSCFCILPLHSDLPTLSPWPCVSLASSPLAPSGNEGVTYVCGHNVHLSCISVMAVDANKAICDLNCPVCNPPLMEEREMWNMLLEKTPDGEASPPSPLQSPGTFSDWERQKMQEEKEEADKRDVDERNAIEEEDYWANGGEVEVEVAGGQVVGGEGGVEEGDKGKGLGKRRGGGRGGWEHIGGGFGG